MLVIMQLFLACINVWSTCLIVWRVRGAESKRNGRSKCGSRSLRWQAQASVILHNWGRNLDGMLIIIIHKHGNMLLYSFAFVFFFNKGLQPSNNIACKEDRKISILSVLCLKTSLLTLSSYIINYNKTEEEKVHKFLSCLVVLSVFFFPTWSFSLATTKISFILRTSWPEVLQHFS